MADEEWHGLLDSLLLGQGQGQGQGSGDDAQRGSDCVAEWGELIGHLAPDPSFEEPRDHGHEQQPQHEQLAASEHMYGKASDLEHIGSHIHRHMFDAFRKTVCRMAGHALHEQNRTREDAYADQYVRSSQRLMSRVCESESTGIPAATISRGLLQYAAALVYGTMFLVGAFWSAWCNMFRRNKYIPIATISKFKYDETPLRLKVKEFNNFLQVNFVGGKSGNATSEQYLHAKIMRIQWNYRHFASKSKICSIAFSFLAVCAGCSVIVIKPCYLICV